MLNQNGHYLTRSPRRDGFAPVVGFGVAFFVQGLNVELNGDERAKQQMKRSPSCITF